MAAEEVSDAHNIRDGDEHQNNEDRRIFLRVQRKAFMPSNSVTRNITIIWKSRFTDAWDTWKKVPKDERDIWFDLFKEGYNEKHGVEDSLDAQSGNGAKTFPKWIDHVGSKNGTAYGVGDVDGYVHQPNIEEPSAQNIPNAELVQLQDMVRVQQLEQNLMKTEFNNLKNAHEAQSKKLDEVVKAQSSNEKRLKKYVAQKVGKVVALEVGKVVAEEVGKATQQLLDAMRVRPV